MKPKVLLLSDDIRSVSGVGRISKDIVVNTSHQFDFVQLAARKGSPEVGHIIDVSNSVNQLANIQNANVKLYTNNGYGDSITLQHIIDEEDPDVILHITDPRYWSWLYDIERTIRSRIPICYYHVWDNYPVPEFNKKSYDSCDWIGCISKLTYDCVKKVGQETQYNCEYIPHGVDENKFFPISNNKLTQFKNKICGTNDYEFIILSNNVNIPRKQLPTVLSSYAKFIQTLNSDSRDKVALIMHTNTDQPEGCDLRKLSAKICGGANVVYSTNPLDDVELNNLYNISDVTINIASNEGFGLTTLESIMSGTPIIVSETGGLVDQVYTTDGKCGSWCSTIKPTIKNLTGSQLVPYIYSDLCKEEDVVASIKYWYEMDTNKRHQCGHEGREFAKQNLSTKKMCTKVASGIKQTIESFKPQPRLKLLSI